MALYLTEKEMKFLEKLEQKDDYLYQKLKEDYNEYLKENKEHIATFYEWMRGTKKCNEIIYKWLIEDYDKYLKDKKHTVTFYEWMQSVLPEYM